MKSKRWFIFSLLYLIVSMFLIRLLLPSPRPAPNHIVIAAIQNLAVNPQNGIAGNLGNTFVFVFIILTIILIIAGLLENRKENKLKD